MGAPKFLSETPTYKTWRGMMNRCYTPTNKDYYGGRVVVAPEWHEYANFVADMGEKPGADYVMTRFDEEDHFHKLNVRWWPRHNKTGTKVYQTWKNMLTRCGEMGKVDNYSRRRYLERGISVCESWLVFDSFFADMGEPPSPEHSLDRVDNNGPYNPENCRWATIETQANNRADNVLVEHMGRCMSLSQWSRELDIPRDRLQARYKAGKRGVELFHPERLIRRNVGVCMLTRDGTEVARFASIKAASETTKLSRAAISKAVSGGNKSCGGHVWCYVD